MDGEWVGLDAHILENTKHGEKKVVVATEAISGMIGHVHATRGRKI